MGLVPPQEHDSIGAAIAFVADRITANVDLTAILEVAEEAEPLGWPLLMDDLRATEEPSEPVVVGVIRDAAFQFYYPENLEALRDRGAIVRELSSLKDDRLPRVDALYIGGGFPETHVDILSRNESFRSSLKEHVHLGLPVYAECGGLMFLCRGLRENDRVYPMVGIFPFDVTLEDRPQGHGYTVLRCERENPFFPVGSSLRGHEFHYSRLHLPEGEAHPDFPFVFRMKKGHGIGGGWDGICYRNVLASYSHIHAVGNSCWAEAIVASARRYRAVIRGEGFDPKAKHMEQESIGNYGYL
jgi:cobyrinic acid a,c-diamide synthase